MSKKEKSLKIPSIIITAVCILVLSVCCVLKPICKLNWINDVLFPLLEMLCSIAITAAIGTYLIEWKGFIQYTQERMSEILAKPNMVKNLNDDYQKRLLSSLINEHTGINDVEFDAFLNKFYDVAKDQSQKYGYYLKEQVNDVSCKKYKRDKVEYIDRNGVSYRILKHTRTSIYSSITSVPKEIKEILRVNVTDKELPLIGKTVVVRNVYVDTERLKSTEYKLYSTQNNEYSKKFDTVYKTKYICELNNPKKFDGHDITIKIEYDTIEPHTDYSYCTRVKQFCKKYKMNFAFDKDDFDIHGQIFMFGERKGNFLSEDSINFEVDDWLLPGEGTNIFIRRK